MKNAECRMQNSGLPDHGEVIYAEGALDKQIRPTSSPCALNS